MGRSAVTMIVGLLLALGMGWMLLVWLERGEGAGITGLLFIFGVLAGIAIVWVGATNQTR